ncbi:polysaccharide lyase family 7 protein [Algibacter sp. L1A34]|uniref:polysaccharide lyase family 7 protein n=1 Tax=Algibacter sp. L1A34 TaxID=2686365 RepID=UPI00131A9956|nr:polysaccharide lyase family 7 protein [Algibacter sp. L1A34]
MYTIAKSLMLSLFFISCSNEKANTDEEDSLIKLEIEIEVDDSETGNTTKTPNGTCSTTVNFEDLVVETSWISQDTGDRDTFDACSVDGENWMDRYDTDIVMLTCLSGDSHRTELKENIGDEAALDHYKKMTFTAKFTNIPENGVTIAQIHNRGTDVKRPWLRLYFDNNKNIKIKETETNPTGSSSDYTTYTGPEYIENQEIIITIITGENSDKKAEISLQMGEVSWTQTLWPNEAWSVKSDTYYLKAGVYTEGNDTTPKVEYSAFSISH